MSGAGGWIEWGIFGALALIAVVTAASMILTMSMYRAGLALMSSFVALAGIFVLLNADMLAAIQIMMNVGGMLIMILFMVMLMMDPGGEMMWEMKRSMRMRGLGALSMRPPKGPPPPEDMPSSPASHTTHTAEPQEPAAPTVYTCPMHPEVRQPTPGKCPKCGMILVPADDQPATAGDNAASMTSMTSAAHAAHGEEPVARPPTVYTCPMHPEVRRSSPEQCPKCGMTLVPAPDTESPTMQRNVVLASGHGEHGEHAEHGAHAHEDTGGMDRGGADPGAEHSGHDAHSGLTPRQNYQMLMDMAMSTAQAPLALGLGALAAALLIAIVILTPWTISSRIPTGDASAPVGVLLLGRYMVGFEGAAFLILAGIAAAVMFARREPHAAPQSATALMPSERSEGMAHASHAGHMGDLQSSALAASGAPESAHADHAADHAASQMAQMDETHERDHMSQMNQMNQEDTTMSDETTPPTSETIYTCPMHPEVRQNAPGNCPICGMFLVPVTDTSPDQPTPDGHEGHGSHDA